MEHILKPGDSCLDCQRQGLTKQLRYFYINLEEKVLKCESDECLYPLIDDDDFDADADADVANNCKVLTELKTLADDGLKIIEELLIDPKPAETLEKSLALAAAPAPAAIFDLNSNVEQFRHEEPTSVSDCDKKNTLASSKRSVKQQKETASSSVTPLNAFYPKPAFISKVLDEATLKTKNCSKRNIASSKMKAQGISSASSNIPKAEIRSTPSMNIPKAQITRFMSAIKTHKKVTKTRASKPNISAASQVIVYRKNKLLKMKKLAEESKTTTTTGTKTRPLDFLQGLLQDDVTQ